MIRVALLGSDSTHTEMIAQRINPAGSSFHGEARVVSLYGEDIEQARYKAKALGIERATASVDEALEGVDFAMVIGRFGDSHFGPATNALARGLPTFVDKPFTVNTREAEALVEQARSANVPLCSSSPLRFATEVQELKAIFGSNSERWLHLQCVAPANCTDLGLDPRFDSVFFYGIHGVEMLLELAGFDVESVAIECGNTAITVSLEMRSKRTATLLLVRNAPEFYSIGAVNRGGSYLRSINLDGSYYEALLAFLLQEFFFGRTTIPLGSTLEAVSILERVEAVRRNGPVRA